MFVLCNLFFVGSKSNVLEFQMKFYHKKHRKSIIWFTIIPTMLLKISKKLFKTIMKRETFQSNKFKYNVIVVHFVVVRRVKVVIIRINTNNISL